MRQKSTVIDRPRTICGSTTAPIVKMFAFSGCSVALPPFAEFTCATVLPLLPVPAPPPVTGAASQRAARLASPCVFAHGSFDDSKFPAASPWYNSRIDGARKAVEYVPRIVRSRIGLYRAPNLYVQSVPNVLYLNTRAAAEASSASTNGIRFTIGTDNSAYPSFT